MFFITVFAAIGKSLRRCRGRAETDLKVFVGDLGHKRPCATDKPDLRSIKSDWRGQLGGSLCSIHAHDTLAGALQALFVVSPLGDR